MILDLLGITNPIKVKGIQIKPRLKINFTKQQTPHTRRKNGGC